MSHVSYMNESRHTHTGHRRVDTRGVASEIGIRLPHRCQTNHLPLSRTSAGSIAIMHPCTHTWTQTHTHTYTLKTDLCEYLSIFIRHALTATSTLPKTHAFPKTHVCLFVCRGCQVEIGCPQVYI